MRQWAQNLLSNKRRLVVCLMVAVLVVVGVGVFFVIRQAGIHRSEARNDKVNTLHDEAVADTAKGNIAAAVARYDAVIKESKGSEKALYLSERASVLFANTPDTSKQQILSDAYAAEKLDPTASTAYFIYTVETYYHDTAAADTYLQRYQERVATNARTE